MKDNKMELDIEISLILAKIYKALKLKHGFVFNLLERDFSKEEMTFYPQLILKSTTGKKSTKKVRTLAIVIQIMYLATEVHSSVYEDQGDRKIFKEEVQLPILIGDLLYSKVYDILCREEALEFLDDFLTYIKNLNLGWIKYLERSITKEELCTLWYGDLAGLAMSLASKIEGANSFCYEDMKDLGVSFGNFFGAIKVGLPTATIKEYYFNIQKALALLPPNKEKDLLNEYVYEICEVNHLDIYFDKNETFLVAEN